VIICRLSINSLANCVPHTPVIQNSMVAAQKYGTAKDALFVDIEQGTGTMATMGYLILYVTSLGYIRRNYFEVFYYSHIVGIVVSIAASMWHEVGIMFYFTPALFLYFVDRFMRSYSSWFQETKLIQLEAAGNNITRVVFEKAHARSSYRQETVQMGQLASNDYLGNLSFKRFNRTGYPREPSCIGNARR
jgi:hypothetical protein